MAKNLWYKLVSEFGAPAEYGNSYIMIAEKREAMIKKGRKMCPVLLISCFYLRDPELSAYEEWCNENLADDYILWNDAIYLKSDDDAIAFKLRWL